MATLSTKSCTFNAAASCCIGRSPPSPDGDPPRQIYQRAPPVKRPGPSPRLQSKDHIPTWKTVGPIELRAILEDEVADGADQAMNLRHRGTAEFEEILRIEEDFESDKCSVNIKRRKSSSTLKAVTEKLKKHLSRETALSKRHSRSSVGTSEEEVERRAELRRIRQKRIQAELSHEGVYDDDSKSVSSVVVAPTPPMATKSHTPWIPGNFVPLPVLTPPSWDLPRLSLPHLSPLEMRSDPFSEPYLSDDSTSNLTMRRWSSPELSMTRVNSEKLEIVSRRYSSPFSELEAKSYISSRNSSIIPSMPPQPVLHPVRLPSIAVPARSSWRLSFASENRGNTLRKLSQGQVVPVTLDTTQLRAISPDPHRGLRSFGLRLSSQAILSSDETGNLASQSETYYLNNDFGGVDGVGSGSAMRHLHEIGPSQRLGSRRLQSSCSSPELSSNASRPRHSSNRSVSTQIHTKRSRFMGNTADSASMSDHIPQSWGKVMCREGSSVYPSVDNSAQASSESSRFNLFSLLSGAKNKTGAAEYQGDLPAFPLEKDDADDYAADLISSPTQLNILETPTTNLSTTSLTVPLTRFPHRTNFDDSSLLASETSSFREREAELSVVQTRFASAEAQRVRTTPVSSKFREEFNSEREEISNPKHRKSSTFSKLTKFAIRSYDGAQLEQLLDVPLPKFDPNELKIPLKSPLKSPGAPTPGFWTPLQDDDTTNVWGNVLGKTGEDRAHNISDNLHLPMPRNKASDSQRNRSAIEEELPKSVLGNLTQLGKGKKKPAPVGHSQSAADEYNERFQERIAMKELVMDSWEEEMAASAARAQERSRNIIKKATPKPVGPDRRYPATWSRYPSHTRSQRVISAGPSNKIEVKDFAVLGREDNGEIIWCLGHDDEGHHSVINEPAIRGIRKKIKERFRNEAYKIDTFHRQAIQTSGRRGSLTTANGLEFPELEVLPFTFLTAEEMITRIEQDAKVADDKAKETIARIEEEEKAEEENAKNEGLDEFMVMFGRDGSAETGVDVSFGSSLQRGSKDVTDPKFDEDCIVPLEIAVQGVKEQAEIGSSSPVGSGKKNKFRTWHGREFDGYNDTYESSKRVMSLGLMGLTERTDEHDSEFEGIERLERELGLKAFGEDSGGFS